MHLIVSLTRAIGVGIAISAMVATTGAFAYSTPHPDRGGRFTEANLPPLAYQLFCLQNPSECRGGGSATATANATLMNKLNRVNNSVNASMTAKADPGDDVWTVGASSGDCEDYALNKRHELIKLGVPASSLRMAVVLTASGEGHAVLVAHTSRGDFVLDNLTNAIRPFSQTGLHMVSIASSAPDNWGH